MAAALGGAGIRGERPLPVGGASDAITTRFSEMNGPARGGGVLGRRKTYRKQEVRQTFWREASHRRLPV